MDVHRIPPDPAHPTGQARCRWCGHTWDTTPEQDTLLESLFAHERLHVAARAMGHRTDDDPTPAA